ncbi:hypothetical protein N9K71_00125 [Candidatus Pelagibacter bacterium]|nr:hypothetical protein [Candidatus Pelagibacter bacterium]
MIDKKSVIQVFLLLIIILICIFFYNLINKKNISNPEINKLDIKKQKDTDELSNSNTIVDIEYITKDQEGNFYLIKAEKSKIDQSNENRINLLNVKGKIRLKKNQEIHITSDEAVYNSLTTDTQFFNNVKLLYNDHLVECEVLTLKFSNKYIILEKNLIYNNLKTKIIADKIEFDLTTKNFKMMMYNKNSKIKIININGNS